MQLKIVAYYVGKILIILSFFMLAPLGLAYYDSAHASTHAYLISFFVSVGLGLGMRIIAKRPIHSSITRKDAFGIVSFAWIGSGFITGLPFLIEGSLPSLSSSFFEGISGLTTTGATVYTDVEVLSRATNLWRHLLHWIGGMGIIVLFVAIFPQLGLGGKKLFKSEVTGPIKDGFEPRIKETALRLWSVYLGFTAVGILFLWIAGLPLFEAICYAFSSLSTGGFSTKNTSIAFFENPLVDWIIILLMLMGSLNFGLYYGAFSGHFSKLFTNIETKVLIFINCTVATVIFFSTTGIEVHDWSDDIRNSIFQAVSITSTTGLMTSNFDLYPGLSKFLLFLCMFVGACSGSTAGGIKISRILIVLKRCLQEIRIILRPQEVLAIKLGQQTISQNVMTSVFIFVSCYILLYLFGVILMFCVGLDWVAASSSVVACLSSVGPGFGAVGPTQNYAFIHPIGKWILSFYMIAGRLELFAILSLFSPVFWRRN